MEYLLQGKTHPSATRREKEWAFQVIAQLEGGMILALAIQDTAVFASMARTLPPKPSGSQ